MQRIRSVAFHYSSDLEEIWLDASRLDKFEEVHSFEEDGREIKGPPACSGVYTGWTHEHVTDEQRRQRTIWGYIMLCVYMYDTYYVQRVVMISFLPGGKYGVTGDKRWIPQQDLAWG
eukprot:superscaffoldBa00001296_g9967